MFNPLKVEKFFKLERRHGRSKKLRYMKFFSIQENNSYNKVEWKTEANVKSELLNHYRNRYWYIISPFSFFSHFWDFLLIFCFLSFVFLLPMRLGVVQFDVYPYINLSQIPVDLYFLISIPVNFFTGVYESSTRTVIYKPSVIANKYLKGYFLVDFLSSLPYDGVVCLYQYYYKVKIPSLVLLIYFFYYLKLIRYFTFLKAFRKALYIMRLRGIVVEILCIVLLWFTLSYLLITTLSYFNSTLRKEKFQKVLHNNPVYVLMFFHNTTNFIFTLSNRLKHMPEGTHFETMGQMMILFITIIIEPFIGAVVIVLYWSTRSSDIKYRAVVDEVNAYTSALSAPDQTKKKIKDYFKMYHDQSRLMDDKKALEFYSAHDQMQIMSFMMDSITMKVELFRDLPPRIRLEVVKKLKREVMLTGYKLTMAGQIGSRMHIVSSGKLLLFTSNSIKISDMGEGSSLGEYQLLADSPYPLTAICAEITTIYTLDRSSFNSVIFHLTDVYLMLREKITERHMNLVLSLDRLRHSTEET